MKTSTEQKQIDYYRYLINAGAGKAAGQKQELMHVDRKSTIFFTARTRVERMTGAHNPEFIIC